MSPITPDISNVIIIGDGVAGAMAAAFLAGALPRETHAIRIFGVDGLDHSLGAFGPVEASSPSTRLFHADIGVGDDQLARHCEASFSLGLAASGWSGSAATFFLPFGDQGAPLSGVAFHQLAARLRAAGRQIRLGDYATASLMAQAGRFQSPSDDPASPLSTYSFGYHVERSRYAGLLREQASAKGAMSSRFRVKRVEAGDDGLLTAAVLENGERVKGDLFIDASGPAAIAIGMLRPASFVSWDKLLPCNRSIEVTVADPVPPSPYSHIEALPFGWRRTVPSNGKRGEALVYSSDFSDRQQAEDFLAGTSGPTNTTLDFRHSSFIPGRQSNSWVGNCVAIGAAACMLEPLASQSIMLVERSLRRLVRLFPERGKQGVEAREFNRETGQELDRARDFVVAHYALNGRVGEPLWDAARNADRPAELEQKLALYRGRGRIPLVDGDLFEESDWAALLDEMNVRAERYDVRADSFTPEQLDQFLARMRQAIIAAVAPLPLHGNYLASIGRKVSA